MQYTYFGQVVRDLMAQYGIASQEELAELLTESSGEIYRQQRISRYLTGSRQVSNWFPHHLAKALDLSFTEAQRLAMAYSYGQVTRYHPDL